MGLITKILVPVTSKDLRNGSARDIAHLKKSMRGTDHRATALQIGHSEDMVRNETTANYIGALQDTVYNMRAGDKFEDRLAPRQAAQAFVARIHKPVEIDEYLIEHDGDIKDPNDGKRASQALRTGVVDSWQETEKDRTVEPGQERRPPPAKRQKTSGKASSSIIVPKDRVARLSLESSTASSSNTPDELIDPVLLRDRTASIDQLEQIGCESTALAQLTSMIGCSDELVFDVDKSDSVGIAAVDSQFQTLLTTPGGPSNSPIYLEGDEFVTCFAAYNLFRLIKSFDHFSEEEVSRFIPTGNSPNKPEPILFHCAKECDYNSINPRVVAIYEVTCDGTPKNAEKPFKCPEEGCGKAFRMEGALTTHVTGTHRWLHRSCPLCPQTTDAHIFQNQYQLSEHYEHNHNDLPEPQQCPLAHDCLSTKSFTTFPSLSEHLRKVHLLTPDRVALYKPEKIWRAQIKVPIMACSIEGCESGQPFYGPFMLRLHLTAAHGMTGAQVVERMPDFTPPETKGRPCSIPNCAGVFQKREQLKTHLTYVMFHRMSADEADKMVQEVFGVPKAPRRKGLSDNPNAKKCPLPACESTSTFDVPSKLKLHLTSKSHAMDTEEASELAREVFGKKQRAPPDPSKAKTCPLPSCQSATLFNYPTQLKRHLTGKTHGMNNDDAQDLAGTAFGK
jgi:uncharacterized C2H2 Zn-finger protein